MTGRYRFFLYLSLLIVFTVVLTILSLRTFSTSTQFFTYQDKVGHFIAYALTAWLACQVLGIYLNRKTTFILAFLYATITGGILELLQAYLTTSRQGEWSDLVANLLGTLTGCVIFSLIRKLNFSHDYHEID